MQEITRLTVINIDNNNKASIFFISYFLSCDKIFNSKIGWSESDSFTLRGEKHEFHELIRIARMGVNRKRLYAGEDG